MAKRKKKPGPKVHGAPSKPVAFRIPVDLLERIDTVAEHRRLSRNKMVELTLREHLPKRLVREKIEIENTGGTDVDEIFS